MRYQYSYYLSSSIKFIQKNKIHSYQFTIKFFKIFTKLIILLSRSVSTLRKVSTKGTIRLCSNIHPVPSNLPAKWQNSRFAKIPEACHSSFREPVAHLSLHPLSPTTLLSFYTTHPCLRACIRVYAVATTFEIPNLT